MKPKLRCIPALMLTLCVLIAPSISAQPQIEKVPGNALAYVGWRGAEDMGPTYEGSNLQGMMQATGLLEGLPQIMDAIRAFGAEEGPPDMVELLNAGSTMWEKAWTGGGAMYILPPPPAQGDQPGPPPVPQMVIIWTDAAEDEQLRNAMTTIVAMVNDQEMMPAFMGSMGNSLYMSIGVDGKEVDLTQKLADQLGYLTAARQVQSDAALTVYVNAQEFLKVVDSAVDMQKQMAEEWDEPASPMVEMWPTLRDVSGLSGVNRLMMTAGIKEKSWQTQTFLDAPAPRKGVLTLVDNEPIADLQLLHIPKSATYLQGLTMDPSKALKVARDMMEAVDPGLLEEFNEALSEAKEEVGVDLEADLIDTLGPTWTMYIDPMIAGNGFASMVLVNELRDANKLTRSLEQLKLVGNDMAEGEIDEGPIKLRIHTVEIDGAQVNYLGIPFIAPSWMVHDGKLYFAMYPQALEMAAGQSGDVNDSILKNDAFVSAMQRLGAAPRTGLSFSNLPETAPHGYGFNLMMVQAFAGTSEMINGKPSPLRLPPVGKLMPYIEPAASTMWADDLGVHMTSLEPFPGSALLGPVKGAESTLLVAGPLAVGIMLPAMGAAQQAAVDVEGVAQGSTIGFAAMAYAVDHNGQYPEDIAALEEYGANLDSLVTPRSMRAAPVPFNFDEWEQDRQQRFVRENSSFVLVPLGKMDDVKEPFNTILVFQRPDDTLQGNQLVVVHADGSTWREDPMVVAEMLEAQTGKTLDELINRQVTFGE